VEVWVLVPGARAIFLAFYGDRCLRDVCMLAILAGWRSRWDVVNAVVFQNDFQCVLGGTAAALGMQKHTPRVLC